jgi:hypothetical protein
LLEDVMEQAAKYVGVAATAYESLDRDYDAAMAAVDFRSNELLDFVHESGE